MARPIRSMDQCFSCKFYWIKTGLIFSFDIYIFYVMIIDEFANKTMTLMVSKNSIICANFAFLQTNCWNKQLDTGLLNTRQLNKFLKRKLNNSRCMKKINKTAQQHQSKDKSTRRLNAAPKQQKCKKKTPKKTIPFWLWSSKVKEMQAIGI